uniref:Transmembrane protein n=1 Tax=Nelumbo nucifera TaxID=4432 RepID=A0A822XVI8_NELNU|nr:TPA_asm: hypothetical protein HUJ06_024644 [Nelumbo nucifera]
MARLLKICLIMAEVLMVMAMAYDHEPVSPNAPKAAIEGSQKGAGSSDPPSSSVTAISSKDELDMTETAESPGIRRMGNHHSSGGSAAGGGVIIGGLATAIFAAIFAYIRVTRRRNAETK